MYNFRLSLLVAFITSAFYSNAQNVGIGVEHPGSKLSVKGGISIGDTYAEKSAPNGSMLIEKSMGIGTDVIDTNVVLDIRSATKGVLFPTMNTATRNSILNPPKGLFVFNEDSSGFNFYNGTNWLNFALLGPTGPVGQIASVLGIGSTENASGYVGSSVSAVTVGTGTKIFLTQLNLAYRAGDRVRISGSGKIMEGVVQTYLAGTLTVNVDRVSGAGLGLSWSIGLAGEVGATGAQGPTGATGTAGARGATGATGAQGIQGVPGATGAQGTQGIQGPQGVQGNMVRTGTGVPAGTLGNVGDFYLNGNDANYYLKTAATTWTYVGNLKGEQGDQGPTGPQGAQGIQGIQGVTGSVGAQGPQGVQGVAGPTGAVGATGARGATGSTGSTGAQGVQGIAGPTGAQGLQGIAGPTGAQGMPGAQGSQGIQGVAGPAGAAGARGATGATGSTGAQGLQGILGIAGPTGVQGAQGIQGVAGPTGAQGVQGIQGATGANGATWLNGAGVPSSATGAVNDFYLNSSNGTYYKKTNSTTWSSQGSLKGATGSTGVTGANGAVGAQGPAGPAGAQGPVGPAGAAGSNGTLWYTGNSTPSSGVGTINDFYLNSSNGTYYKKTNSTTWASQGSLKGATGSTGAQGPAGTLSNGSAAGNTPYWNGSSWVVNSSNVYNNGSNVGIGTVSPAHKLEVMNGNLSVNNTNNTAGSLVMYEPSNSGSNFTAFKARAQAADITYNLPVSQAANTILINDGAGNLSWTPVNSTVTTMFEKKGSNEAVANSTLQDDNDFVYTLEPNQSYEISGLIRISAHADGEWKFQFVAPSQTQTLISMAYNTEYLDEMMYVTAPNTVYYMLNDGANQNTDVVFVNGMVTTGNQGGSFKFQWAQKNTNGNATTIYANSYIRLTRVE